MQHLRFDPAPASLAAASDLGDFYLTLVGLPAPQAQIGPESVELFHWADDGGWFGEG